MKILFTAHSGASHLRALAAIAQQAQRRGHEVAVASAPSNRDAAVGYGLQFHAVGRDWSDYPELAPELGMLILRGDLDTFLERMFGRYHFGRPAVDTARDLIELVGRLRPDVIVREGEDVAGYLAAEAYGLPHVAVVSGNTHDLRAADRVPGLNGMRRELGLPDEPAGGGLYRHKLASLLPPRYYGEDVSGPTVAHYRASNPDGSADTLPPWFAALDGSRPLVLASLGTVAPQLHSLADGTLRDIITALSEIDCEAIVSVGVGRSLDELPTVPSHVRLIDTWLPQSLILETADLFITHAGLGSVREAVRAGVPIVALPQWDDQIYQAQRCEDVGIGRLVDRPRRRSGAPGPIADACRAVLADPGYRQNARALQRELLALPSIATLLDDIEGLAASVRPLRLVA